MSSSYLVIRSEDRNKSFFPNPNDFRITSAQTFFGETGIYNVRPESVSFFYNIPNINATNNVILVDNGVMSFPVTVPESFYDYTDLATALAIALNALAIGVFTVTWNTTTYRYVITSTVPVTINQYPPLRRDLGAVMGFAYGLPLSTTITGQAADLAYTRNIYITSNTLNRHKSASDQTSSQQQNILCVIPVYPSEEFIRSNALNAKNDYLLNPRSIYYEPHNMKVIKWNTEAMGDIDIRVYDDYDQLLYNGWGSQFSWSFRISLITNKA
jgi:hypothetical protein